MKFRIAYFTPDPFRADRFAVGALFGTGTSARFERAHVVPGPDCLGGVASWNTLEMALDTLAGMERFDVEPGIASQLITFGEPSEMPAGVSNPSEWLHGSLLDRGHRPTSPRGSPARERRDTYGKRFFERWHVDQYVRARFDLAEFSPSLGALPRTNHKPTHWVRGDQELMLMEPIVGTRPSLDEDLKIVGESLLAHLKLFEMAKVCVKPEMYAYVFSNGYREAVSDTRRALQQIVRVVDLESSQARDEFLDRIKSVARTSPVV